MTLTRRQLLLAAAAAAAAGGPARAQEWPTRPIRLIDPFTPGGSSDVLGRAIAQKLTASLGQSVVLENVPGAGGTVGADRVAKSPADGYTLLIGHIGTLAVSPLIYPQLPYDPLKDFVPVAWLANVVNVLAVHPSVPVRSLPELVAYARANPGRLNYRSGGNGSAAHLAGEYLKMVSETFMVHVPYRGTAPAMTDTIAGRVQLVFTGAPAVIPAINAGQLRPLAVSSSKRLPALPDVPTVAESGYPGFEADQWYGIVAPAGTPAAVVQRLNGPVNQALASAELQTRFQTLGAIGMPSTPEVFGRHIAQEIERWRPVVKAGNIQPG
ncbi:Bug family tripartite tricarboxylate transporter substrate binding protein [Pigmentiphaga humi]